MGAGVSLPNVTWGATFESGLDAVYAGDQAKALSIWKILAARGDVRAQYRLARLYDLNSTSNEKNPQRAIDWYRKAAEQGLAAAQSRLGELIAEGRGVPEDPVRAFEFWRAAAEQGHAAGQYSLGLAYFRGAGTSENTELAKKWLRASAGGGYAPAQFVLGQLRNEGLVVAQDQGLALAWFLRATDNGHLEATAQVRALLATGVSPATLPDPIPAGNAEDSGGANEELVAAKAKIAALAEERETLVQDKNRLQASLDETLGKLDAQEAVAMAQATALEGQLASVQLAAKTLDAEAKTVGDKSALKSEELIAAQQEILDLSTAIDEFEAKASEAAQAQTSVQREIAALQAQVTARETDLAKRDETVADAERKIATLQADATAGSARLLGKDATLAEAQAEVAKLTESLKTKEVETVEQAAVLTSAEAKFTTLEALLTEVEDKLIATEERAQTDLKKLDGELAETRQEVVQITALKTGLEESLKTVEVSAKTVIVQLEAETSDAAEQAARVGAAAKLWEQDALSKGDELSKLRAEMALTGNELAAAEGLLSAKDRLLASLKAGYVQELMLADEKIRKLETAKTSSENRIATQAERVSLAERRISDLTTALTAAEDALGAKDEEALKVAAKVEVSSEPLAVPRVETVKTAAAAAVVTNDANLKRGDEFLALGDIASARLFYELSMDSGNKRAATSIGKTYDPVYLLSLEVVGAPGRPAKAREWYEIAAGAGDADAVARLKALQAWEQR